MQSVSCEEVNKFFFFSETVSDGEGGGVYIIRVKKLIYTDQHIELQIRPFTGTILFS